MLFCCPKGCAPVKAPLPRKAGNRLICCTPDCGGEGPPTPETPAERAALLDLALAANPKLEGAVCRLVR